MCDLFLDGLSRVLRVTSYASICTRHTRPPPTSSCSSTRTYLGSQTPCVSTLYVLLVGWRDAMPTCVLLCLCGSHIRRDAMSYTRLISQMVPDSDSLRVLPRDTLSDNTTWRDTRLHSPSCRLAHVTVCTYCASIVWKKPLRHAASLCIIYDAPCDTYLLPPVLFVLFFYCRNREMLKVGLKNTIDFLENTTYIFGPTLSCCWVCI